MGDKKMSLKAADICRIIKQCHESNVESFEHDGIKLTFHSRRNEGAVLPGQVTDHTTNIEPVVSADNSETKDQVDLMDEQSMLEAEEAQTLIDDPMGFERTQIDRQVERARQYT